MNGPDSRTIVKTAFSEGGQVHYVSGEELKKVQGVLLETFSDFADCAEKHGIRYTLGGGSVLGAVRHQGFIPWDDDIDVNITREGYEKLKKVFEAELGARYYLCAPELTEGHGLALSQIRRKGTVYKTFNNYNLPEEESGIGIDLFIIENTYDNRLLRTIHGMHCLAAGYLLNCRKIYDILPGLLTRVPDHDEIEALFRKKYRIGRFLRHFDLDAMARYTLRCYGRCRNSRSKFVTVPSGRKHFFGELYRREDLCEARQIPFEDRTAPVPVRTEQYLTHLYGKDYMELPPEGKREQHPVLQLEFDE